MNTNTAKQSATGLVTCCDAQSIANNGGLSDTSKRSDKSSCAKAFSTLKPIAQDGGGEMDSNSALVVSKMRKLAAELGVVLQHCHHYKQLSAGARIESARQDVLSAVESFNPKNDESQLTLSDGCALPES